MVSLLLLTFAIALGAVSAVCQDAQPCPANLVCITPDAARKALRDSDTVKAQADEITVLKKAIEDTKQIVNDMKVELAKTTGELTGAQQSMVDARAVITVLSGNCKARNKIGLLAF